MDLTSGSLPLSPWVLVDDVTCEQTAALLGRLVDWLRDADPTMTRDCASSLSLGEDDDPEVIAGWADALAARLRARQQGRLG